MTTLLTREFTVRATDDQTRTITGLAVPYNDPIDLYPGIREQVAPGAVEPIENPKLFAQHRDVIGKIISGRDTEAGYEITAVISETARGDEIYTLLRDGVLDKFSIGFMPIEHTETKNDDGTTLITHTRLSLWETSVVTFPAYNGATIQSVRHQENRTMPETATPEAPSLIEFTNLRESVDELVRRFELGLGEPTAPPVPTSQFRSAGHLLKQIVRGDDTALSEYQALLDAKQRAYEGATTEDSTLRPQWVGDLTRIIEDANVLASIFSTGILPNEGNKLEYGQLESDTTTVEKQANEGDDLANGKVKVTTESADVETFGGYTQLTRQAIERSSVPYLNTALKALAAAAGKRRAIELRKFFAAAITAQTAAGNTVTVADGDDWTAWVSAIVDAAEKYTDLALGMDALVADKTIFKRLATMTAEDGRPVMTVTGTGVNVVGSINAKAISGDLAGVTVRLNPKQTAAGAAFVNAEAIRVYNSPIAQLQDENIINLSKDFSLYYYSASALEIPAAIVPVAITA